MLADQLLKIVERQPDSVAISDSHRGNITYGELWQYLQATSVALDNHLGQKTYVGGIADQDAYAVIAYIAVMLTGRIIIPIDPRYDASLAGQMLQPFTHDVLSRERTTLLEPFATLLLEELVTKTPAHYTFNTSNADAYILHTSGTTGRPKPVLADQTALLQVASALVERYHITPDSKVLQFAYLSFDSSLIEIWSTLLGGGTLIIPGDALRDDLYGCLEKLLRENRINTATLPSSVAGNVKREHLYTFDTLILAGDECPVELANALYPHIPHLINAYGPTESIICSTTYEIHAEQRGRVPIGTPLPGMRIFIDQPDDNGYGEMLLSSTYLAKGYTNNPELTNSKFQTHGQQRFYKSGDIGRLTDEGSYEFLGRVDNQVKISGQRVELEGIEAQIRIALKKNDVAVVSVFDKLYCVYRSGEVLAEFNDLKNLLQGSLPEYAVPSLSLPIEKMPLDPNGKIDRKALQAFIANSYTPTEVVREKESPQFDMIQLWARVLKVPEASIETGVSFFAAGGDSLGALRLVKTINDHYSTSVKLSEIIANPTTLESMLDVVNRSKKEDS